ncbi:MAG: NUDIX hydrolase [Gammaproteobacteria bacterium]
MLVPVVLHATVPTILFTERTRNLLDHAGQVSFPGGSRELSDSGPVQTALREAFEETGIDASRVTPVGFLDGYLTITGYAVTPVVGLVTPGFELKPDPAEVAEIFEVPIAFLRDPANLQTRTGKWGKQVASYYQFEYQQHVIWGATAAMLVDFLHKLMRSDTHE